MLLNRFTLSLSLSIALSACGGSSGGSQAAPAKPLTPEQRSKVSDVSQAMDVANQAAQKASGKSGFGRLVPMSLTEIAEAPPAKTKEEKTRDMTNALQGVCEFEDTMPKTPPGEKPVNGEFHMKVGGANCPIAMRSSATLSTAQSSGQVQMSISLSQTYQVLKDTYRQLNDISLIDMKGTMGMRASESGMTASGNIGGSIESEQYGKLNVSVLLSMNASSKGVVSTMTQTIQFADFAAIGRLVVTGGANNQVNKAYFINDQPASEQEFQAVFGTSLGGNLGS